MMPEEREVKTKDFYQACLLKSMNYPLLRMERGVGDFQVFVFDDPDFTAEEILGRYWDGEVTVNAKVLIDNIKELKTRIHTTARGRYGQSNGYEAFH